MNGVVRRRVMQGKVKPKDIINTRTYRYDITAGSVVSIPQQWYNFIAGRDYTFEWSFPHMISYIKLSLIAPGTTTEKFSTGKRWKQKNGSWTLAPITTTCDRLRGILADVSSSGTLILKITETIHPS